MKQYGVKAVPWVHGWELHVDGVGITQVDRLEDAEQQVRDFMETMTESSFPVKEMSIRIVVSPNDAPAGTSSR